MGYFLTCLTIFSYKDFPKNRTTRLKVVWNSFAQRGIIIQCSESCLSLLYWVLALPLQVDDVDIRYHTTEEEEAALTPEVGSPCWDSVAGSPPDTDRCLQNRHASLCQNGERVVQGSAAGPPEETSPHFSLSSPLPSSPLASAFRLFEAGQRTQTCPSSLPGFSHRGASLQEVTQSLR